MQSEKIEQTEPAPSAPTLPVEPTAMNLKTTLADDFTGQQEAVEIGMGFFSPHLFGNAVLYFYGDLNFEKSLLEHAPYDSITFKHNEYNQFEIATAPPP